MTDSSLSDDEWLVGIGASTHTDDDADISDDRDDRGDVDEQDTSEDAYDEDEEYDEEADIDEDDPDEPDDESGDSDPSAHTGGPQEPAVAPELTLGELLPEYTRPETEMKAAPSGPNPRRRFTPWVLGAGAVAVAATTVVTAIGASSNTAEPEPTASVAPVTRKTPPPPRPAPTPPVDVNADGPIPFMASSDCDSAGSTPAQSVAVPDSAAPFICVLHGPGQIVDFQLGPPGMPESFVVTGVLMVPGAVGAPNRPATEPDPWLAHRVPTRVQWSFNDPANTVVSMQTHNVRGEVVKPVPRVTASHVQLIIQETSRPPVAHPAPAPEQQGGNIFGDILGSPPAGTQAPVLPGDSNAGQSDPSDRTFAISAIKIIGHRP